jgi:hypothetical protein
MKRFVSISVVSTVLLWSALASAQPATPPVQSSTESTTLSDATVVSSSRTTLVVRGSDGQYRLYVMNSATTRPAQVPPGAIVTITSAGSDPSGAPLATTVRVTTPAPAAAPAGAAPPPGGQAPAAAEPVPQAIRNLESTIQRQTRRYRVGVQAGATLDPELISIGGFGQLGPFFSENVWGRGGLELGFGELTTMLAFNFEGLYRIPVTVRGGTWNVYFGAGPAFIFSDRSFTAEGDFAQDDDDETSDDGEEDGDEEEDDRFNDFSFDTGLNFLMGVQSRGGLTFELKTTAYASPSIRFLVGFAF